MTALLKDDHEGLGVTMKAGGGVPVIRKCDMHSMSIIGSGSVRRMGAAPS